MAVHTPVLYDREDAHVSTKDHEHAPVPGHTALMLQQAFITRVIHTVYVNTLLMLSGEGTKLPQHNTRVHRPWTWLSAVSMGRTTG